MVESNKKILFLTWDGPQVSYLESLFAPIFSKLIERGYQFHVIQFTWGNKKGTKETCRALGVPYKKVSVVNKLSIIGHLYTLLKGYYHVRRYVNKNPLHAVMVRSVFLLPIGIRLKKKRKLQFIFDTDGLALDERIDTKIWSPCSVVYRMLRDLEYMGLINANLILVRSKKAIDFIKARGGGSVETIPIEVVRNGRDEEIFNIRKSQSLKNKLGISKEEKILIYVGSIGKQYCIEEMFRFFEIFQQKHPAKFLILTTQVNELDDFFRENKFDRKNIIIKAVPPDEVVDYINIADFGISFRIPSFSMSAIAPIKVGEYLLCGIPILANKGVGDIEEIMNPSGCGYLLDNFSDNSMKRAAEWFDNTIVDKSYVREKGIQYFSLGSCLNGYDFSLKKLDSFVNYKIE